LVLKAFANGVDSRRAAKTPDKAPAAPPLGKGLRMEKGAAQPEAIPSRPEGTPGRTTLLGMEGAQGKPIHSLLDTPRARAMKGEKEPVMELPQVGKMTPLAVEKSEGEKKISGPALAGRPQEKKKPDLSLKFDGGTEKKATLTKEKLRILSCGQPQISSASSLEVPLTLEVETSEKSFPLNINLSIKLEPVDPKID